MKWGAILVLLSTIFAPNLVGQFGISRLELNGKTYLDNLGGIYYVREIENEVFWFAEHPGRNYAHVFKGKKQGNKIIGKWWDVPKFGMKGSGNLELLVKESGRALNKSNQTGGFGATNWSSTDINRHLNQLPRKATASFQEYDSGNLTGAWNSDDGGKYYVRQLGNTVVWYGEKDFKKGDQPSFANIFIGRRSGRIVTGSFVDVPKGKIMGNGKLEFEVVGGNILKKKSGNNFGGNQWTREYAIDISKMAANIEKAVSNKCIGFGYAISKNGSMVKQGGGGNRVQLQDDGPLRFGSNTPKGAQSTSKTLTTIGVLKLLEKDNFLSPNTPIWNYLPLSWGISDRNIYKIRIKHLLTHTSGLRGTHDKLSSMKTYLSNGATGTFGDFEYANINFTLFRVIISYIIDPVGAKNAEKMGNETLEQFTSHCYRNYMKDKVFNLSRLFDVDTKNRSSGALYYDFRKPTQKGCNPGDLTDIAGAGGWFISAREFTKVLSDLENGKYFSKSTLKEMKNNQYGTYAGKCKIGTYYTHNGAVTWCNGIGGAISQYIMFPNNVQVMIQINSNNNGLKDTLVNILKNAFERALR